MAQLRQDFEAFQQAETAILVVGPEDAEAFRKYFNEHDLPFVGLPDPEHNRQRGRGALRALRPQHVRHPRKR
jgi:peroxiredoxin Q/BCP